MKAWECTDEKHQAPTKSSLTQIRSRIRHSFFQGHFEKLISEFEPHRLELRGYRLYAVDGQELRLPCSQDILDAGYRGRVLTATKETYYPHMYITHAYDPISGVTKDVRFGPNRQEIVDAIDMVKKFERNSIALYDRYYLSKKLIAAHQEAGNFFVARCKRAAFGAVDLLFASDKTRSSMTVNGVIVQLVKVKNPRTNEAVVLATNLPMGVFKKREIALLYTRRWSIEGVFRDATVTHLRLENWHSKTINGVLQELFTHYWLMNFSRIHICMTSNTNASQWLQSKYQKPCFKLLLEIIVDAMSDIVRGRWQKLLSKLSFYIQKTMETRFHLKRHYPRQIKTPDNRYQRAKTVNRRAA